MERINTVYLVAQFLKENKQTYIHDLKRTCKCNNPMARIKSLRNVYNWQIDTIKEGVVNGVAVYHYKLIKEGKEVPKFR